MNKEIKQFKRKLIDARKKMIDLEKDGINDFKKYRYVTLQNYYDVCINHLLDEGLFITHLETISEGSPYIVTSIRDVDSTETIESWTLLDKGLTIQNYGAALTYYKKYHISSLLCLRVDNDDDAESVERNRKTYITHEEAKKLSEMMTLLNESDRKNIIKAIGTSNAKNVEANKYEAVNKLIQNAIDNTIKE